MRMFKTVSHCSWLFSLSLLLLCLDFVLGWRWSELVRVERQEPFDEFTLNDTNETTTATADATTTFAPTTNNDSSSTTDLATSATSMATAITTEVSPAPVLSANAIANIVTSGVAIIFLTTILCYLMATFNQIEHRDRVRTALQRNKQIDRQIAAARARQQQQNAALDRDGLKVETVGVVGDGRSLEVSLAINKVLSEEKVDIEKSNDLSKEGKSLMPASRETAVYIEDKMSGTSCTDDDDKPLISVSEAAPGEASETARQQPVLLVQPAQPEELV